MKEYNEAIGEHFQEILSDETAGLTGYTANNVPEGATMALADVEEVEEILAPRIGVESQVNTGEMLDSRAPTPRDQIISELKEYEIDGLLQYDDRIMVERSGTEIHMVPNSVRNEDLSVDVDVMMADSLDKTLREFMDESAARTRENGHTVYLVTENSDAEIMQEELEERFEYVENRGTADYSRPGHSGSIEMDILHGRHKQI